MLISTASAAMAQAAVVNAGTRPNSATAAAATTHTAGSWARQAPSRAAVSPPTSPTRAPCSAPMLTPAASTSAALPVNTNTRCPASQRSLPTPVASNGSARTAVSSARMRSTACTANSAATMPAKLAIVAR